MFRSPQSIAAWLSARSTSKNPPPPAPSSGNPPSATIRVVGIPAWLPRTPAAQNLPARSRDPECDGLRSASQIAARLSQLPPRPPISPRRNPPPPPRRAERAPVHRTPRFQSAGTRPQVSTTPQTRFPPAAEIAVGAALRSTEKTPAAQPPQSPKFPAHT